MGDRLLGFPIKRYKYRHCYNIDTLGEPQIGDIAALVLCYHILCYNQA
jgi:hypothetical protein